MHLNYLSKGRPLVRAQSDTAALKSQLMAAVIQAVMTILPLVMQFSETKDDQQA